MMRRLLCLLLALCCLLPAFSHAEEPSLLTADTVEEVNRLILLPTGETLPVPQRGAIRFISLNEQDPAFRAAAWQSDRFNLMSKDGGYRADHTNMHNRAVYCMAMSYLGVDVTPVMMSELVGSRDMTAPYDGVTAKLDANVERVQPRAYVFDTMIENYLTDDSYSPVMCTFELPTGALYTVLIVGYIPSTGGFIIVDPAAPWLDGQHMHSYKMAWHVMRQVVLSSAFYDKFYGSTVVNLYQWRLVEE